MHPQPGPCHGRTIPCLVCGRGRLQLCTSSENCTSSTSIQSPEQFAPPWDYSLDTTDAQRALQLLVESVAQEPGAEVLEVLRAPKDGAQRPPPPPGRCVRV